MSKLPEDRVLAFDMVKDTLFSAVSLIVAKLNEERSKEHPDQTAIDKFQGILDEIQDTEHEMSPDDLEELQKIDDKFTQFIKANRR